MSNWSTPTTYAERFAAAVTMLCQGRRPPDAMLAGWLDRSSDELQEFAIDNGPAWAQGIVLLDAAKLLADSPTEGVNHGQLHYPEEWGPSTARRLTCVCGNPDPAHADKTPNAKLT